MEGHLKVETRPTSKQSDTSVSTQGPSNASGPPLGNSGLGPDKVFINPPTPPDAIASAP